MIPISSMSDIKELVERTSGTDYAERELRLFIDSGAKAAKLWRAKRTSPQTAAGAYRQCARRNGYSNLTFRVIGDDIYVITTDLMDDIRAERYANSVIRSVNRIMEKVELRNDV